MNFQNCNAKIRKIKFREDELRYLYKNAGKVPLDVMADHLRRTKESIQKKCNLMGLETRLK